MKSIPNPPELTAENKSNAQSNPVKYITVFVYNNPDGLGDFKHGLDMYTELSKMYKGTDTKIKLIALVDANKSKIIPHLLEEEFKQQVYYSQMSHPEQIQEEEYKKNIIVLTDWIPEDKSSNTEALLSEKVINTIQNSPELLHHLANTEFYLNVSMQIKYNRYILDQIKNKCFAYSVCEYGPMISKQSSETLIRVQLPVAECSLGFRKSDAGVKFDETIWEQAKLTTTESGKLAALTALENKKLFVILQNSHQPDKSVSSTNYFHNHYLAIGYVQNQQAANTLLISSIDSSKNKQFIDIFVPHKFLNDESLVNMLKEKNIASFIKIKPDGTEEIIQITGDKNGKVCRCIDFQGLNEHDRKILTTTADIIAGSGDNSFSDALSNPNALPLFQLSPWKKYFYESFLDYIKSHQDGTREYQLLIDYLQLMGISDKEHHINSDAFNHLVKNHHDVILIKWKEVLNKLHQNHNYANNLKILALASEIHASIKNGTPVDTILSNPIIEHLLQSDNIFAHHALLVAGVSTNNVKFVKYVCNRLELLPRLSEKVSFTEYAISNGWKDVANILSEKDLEFIQLISAIDKFYALHPNITEYFDNLKQINIAFTMRQSLIDRLQNYPWLASQVNKNLLYNKAFPAKPDEIEDVVTEYMKNFFVLKHGDYILCCKEGNYFQLSWNNNQLIKETISEPTLGLFKNLVKSWQARAVAESMGTYIPTIDDLINNKNYSLFSVSPKLFEISSKIMTKLTQLKSEPMSDDRVNKELCLKLLLSILYSNQHNYDLLKNHVLNLEAVKDYAHSIYQIALEEQASIVVNNLLLANFTLSVNQKNELIDHLLTVNNQLHLYAICAINPQFITILIERTDSEQLKNIILNSILFDKFNLFENRLQQEIGDKININEVYQRLKEPQVFEAIIQLHDDTKAISILSLANLTSSETLMLLNDPSSSYHHKYDHLTTILFEEDRIDLLKHLITKLDQKDTQTLCESLKDKPDIVNNIRNINSANISPRLRAHAYIDVTKKSHGEKSAPDTSLRPPRT